MYKNLLILLALLCSCQQQRIDNPLLDGHQYTLWYLKDSIGENPEFLYIDCYGKFYTLEYNYQTGYFFPAIENRLTGKWKYDSDTSIYLNNSSYSITISRDTITYFTGYEYSWENDSREPSYYDRYLEVRSLEDKSTGESFSIRETRFPVNLYKHTEENIKHYKKWRRKIKKSPLLDGWDYKLWHVRNLSEDYDHTYQYYDKYGQTGLVYLSSYENRWIFSNPHEERYGYARSWYQRKDTIYTLPHSGKYKLLKKDKRNDRIKLYNINTGYEYLMSDTNITPKK